MDWHHCTLCPRRCGADRTLRPGFCGGTDRLRVARAALHFGEEPCITGKGGSGAVFFGGCALRCRFCQNAMISRDTGGEEISVDRLAEIFAELQDQGAENINLVTPSHYSPLIAQALKLARSDLKIPAVCNCGGYESAEIMHEFEGLVDVYMPDLKYFDANRSLRYSGASDYFAVASFALKEMFRQTGPCVFDENGVLQRGVLIRHLVLPGGKTDAIRLLNWIADTFPKDSIRISLLRQYVPCGDLTDLPELRRRVFSAEYDAVIEAARERELLGYIQGKGCATLEMTPVFDLTGVKGKRRYERS